MVKNRFWITLVGLCLTFFWFTPWRFQTNDDVMMMWLISGAYTGTPESYAIFIHPLLSGILSLFYSVFPEVRWYGLFCYFSIALSSFLVLKLIERGDYTSNWKLFWRFFILAISIHLSVFPQFTLLSGYLGLSGILYLFEQNSATVRFNGLAVLALVLGMLFRWESTVLIFLGWVWFTLVFSSLEKKKWKHMLILGAGLALTFGTKKFYENAFVDQDFLEFNHARAKVIDHPIMVREYFSNQIPVNSDWFFFASWMFEELPIGTEDLTRKKELLDESFSRWEEFFESVKRLYKIQRTELFKSMLILFLLFGIGITPFTWKKKVLFLGLWLTFFLVFNHFNMLLGRVTFLFFLILLFPIFKKSLSLKYAQFWNFSSFFILIFLSIHISNVWAESKGRLALNEEMKTLLLHKPENMPVFLEGYFEYNFTERFSRNKLVPVLSYGWISRSPFQKKAYEIRGFESQKSLNRFSLIAVKMPDPLAFPAYMNRISPGFEVVNQEETPTLIRLDFEKIIHE